MASALVVTQSEKGAAFLQALLHALPAQEMITVDSCLKARQLAGQRDIDICVINAPLKDETGEELALFLAQSAMAQVILLVKAELFDAVSLAVEGQGVITVSKPVNRTLLWQALKMALAAQERLRKMRGENQLLKQKIEDIRVIDRAKCLLIAYFRMTEEEAHKYIEQRAMDTRESRRAVAEDILKTYEN